VIERPLTPLFRDVAFATGAGCGALSFSGNATTDSFDSSAALVNGQPVLSANGASVGTNGNLTQTNGTTINGNLSSPATGVGACGGGNLTARTTGSNATLGGALVQLPQSAAYTTPSAPSPMPPTTRHNFHDCTGLPHCSTNGGDVTITPPSATSQVTLGNIDLGGNTTVHLNAGIYVINGLDVSGNAEIIIDSGPVVFQVAGQGAADVVRVRGNRGIGHASFDPAMVRFVYGGIGDISLGGNAWMAATLYAPNAAGTFEGDSHFYGAMILNQITAGNDSALHYDRALRSSSVAPGPPTMSGFNWKRY
jgi:hypothetical protein